MTTPAAGWYADPGGSGGQRYWSGTAWTDQVTPLAGKQGPNTGSANSEWPPLSPPDAADGPGSSPVTSNGGGGEETGASGEVPTTPDLENSQGPEVPSSQRPEGPQNPKGSQNPFGYGSPSGGSGMPWGSEPAPEVSHQVHSNSRMRFGPDGQALAGWWRRLIGYAIDGVAIGIAAGLVVAIVGTLSGTFDQAVNTAALEDLLNKIDQGAAEQQPYQPTSEEFRAVLGPGFWTLAVIGWLVSVILSVLNGVVLVARSGQTIGDRVVQTRKVVAGRRPPGIGIAFLRWLIPMALILASNIPFLGVVGYAAWLVDYLRPLWSVQRQTWHDKATGTYVERADLAGPLAK